MQDANVLEKNFTVEQEQVPPERCGVKSNISVSLAEAMLATSAVPMQYKPIKMNIEGEQLDFVDGGLYYESPVAIAISEARRLCPNRPIGVIMSLGLSAKEDDYTRRAIDIARQSHPNLYFHRIIPHEIMDTFHYLETDPDEIASFEEELMSQPMIYLTIPSISFLHRIIVATKYVNKSHFYQECPQSRQLPHLLLAPLV